MFQGSQKPARHLPDLVPSSCALAPRQTREAGFLVQYKCMEIQCLDTKKGNLLLLKRVSNSSIENPNGALQFIKKAENIPLFFINSVSNINNFLGWKLIAVCSAFF